MTTTTSRRYVMLPLLASAAAMTGCSTSNESETIAAKHDAPVEVQAQASRNNGAWGAVYMSRDELAEPRDNIVNISALPTMDEDSELDEWRVKFGDTNAFVGTDGKKLYHDSCAGCHMHQGEGAQGAGYYPPLANNSKMQSKYYIIDILINGFRGMPSFHSMMSDEQMAAVTQYVHSELNGFNDTVTKADVAQLRHDNPPASTADPTE